MQFSLPDNSNPKRREKCVTNFSNSQKRLRLFAESLACSMDKSTFSILFIMQNSLYRHLANSYYQKYWEGAAEATPSVVKHFYSFIQRTEPPLP